MKIQRLLISIALLSLISGCYFGITGRVIDSETNQPIEGAVVLVEWTKTKGLGFYATESYKVAEIISDKDGNVNLPGCYSPFVNPPDVTVYKRGYVAWNNKYIFPGYKKRINFQWSDYTFKLEHFKSEYLHDDHTTFIHGAIHVGSGRKKLIFDVIAPEEDEAFSERKKGWKK